ncbi:PAS domain-containing sensor histidine kinase [Methanocella conradii]|uniref:PAS domain-containing sensor histidine kinase n=1 Tax=Methanocella conradii TaxID=1175444 RepID=UPI00157E2A50|nr:PAS domain-containing sensor histidine kinase [Methanocella conradii]
MKQLHELGRFAADAINMGAMAFVAWYRDGRILTANPQFFEMTGYAEDETSGMLWPMDFTTPESKDSIIHAMDGLYKGEKAYHHDEGLIRKDGSKVPVEVFVHIYYPERQAEHYYYSFISDITQRKESEKALKRSKASTDLYLDILTHDINNMNEVGIGYLELALDHLRTEGKITDKTLLERPLMALEYTTSIIRNVRTLQRIESKGAPGEPVDICSVLLEVKKQYSRVPGREVTINYRPTPECYVLANELLREVFLNLVGNAVKHSDPKKPLTVNIIQRLVSEGDKKYCRVDIEDNGPGIPDEMKKSIFERFRQEGVRPRARGLGLYIVRTLVEEYKGKVWVEDRVPGDHTKGARFVVMLPLFDR